MRVAALCTAGLLLTGPALAQDAPDPRWTPWLGCWQVEADATRGGPPAAPRGAVCVSASGSGAAITTTPEGTAPMTQQITADDTARPIADGACTGTERSTWSADGFRLYSRAELTCAGTRRNVSSLSMLAPDGTWIDAQAIDIGDRSSVRVRRFVKDGGAPATPARGRLTVAQVQDASRHVAAAALEAALVEARATFGLDRASLVALADAGVAESVIDVMVALTYPQAFAIHPAAPADRLTAFPFEADLLDGGPWWPGGPDTLGNYFNSAYYFAPFGYAALGGYPLVFGAAGADGGHRGDTRTRTVNGGRVINGLGYTRPAPRRADDAVSTGGGTAGDRTIRGGAISGRGYTRGDGGASTSSSGAAGAGGAGSGSGGGSASSGGGRSAVDR